MSKLTPKQKRFVDEYLIDLNATQAAIRAGYSKRTANEQAGRLLVNVSVQLAIKEKIDERSQRTEVTQDEIIQILAKIARRDIKDFVSFDDDGKFRLKSSSDIDGTIIDGIEEDVMDYGDYQKVSRKLKFPDRMKAIELLGKHLGMFKNDVNLSGILSVTIVDDVDE